MKLKLASALVCFLCLSSCATSEHSRSKSERAQRAARLFDQLDTNHDGYLTKAELMAGLRYAGTPDLNPNVVLGLKTGTSNKVKANRKLTEAEIQKTMAEAFSTRNGDLDHRLSKDEFKKLVVERPPGEEDNPFDPFM